MMLKQLYFIVQISLFSLMATTLVHAEGPKPMTSNDLYITGGIVGTLVGFGIGHGIEGRYADKGWIFTATEAASVALIIVGAVVPMPQGASIPLIVVGALGLTGFKIWEIVDIWTGPMPQRNALFPDALPQNSYARNIFGDKDMPMVLSQGGLTLRF